MPVLATVCPDGLNHEEPWDCPTFPHGCARVRAGARGTCLWEGPQVPEKCPECRRARDAHNEYVQAKQDRAEAETVAARARMVAAGWSACACGVPIPPGAAACLACRWPNEGPPEFAFSGGPTQVARAAGLDPRSPEGRQFVYDTIDEWDRAFD